MESKSNLPQSEHIFSLPRVAAPEQVRLSVSAISGAHRRVIEVEIVLPSGVSVAALHAHEVDGLIVDGWALQRWPQHHEIWRSGVKRRAGVTLEARYLRRCATNVSSPARETGVSRAQTVSAPNVMDAACGGETISPRHAATARSGANGRTSRLRACRNPGRTPASDTRRDMLSLMRRGTARAVPSRGALPSVVDSWRNVKRGAWDRGWPSLSLQHPSVPRKQVLRDPSIRRRHRPRPRPLGALPAGVRCALHLLRRIHS